MTPDDPLPGLAALFRGFAAHGCPGEPVYVALCHELAGQPELMALLLAAPETERKPNLLLAALHERLLADADRGAAPDPLAAYFPSVGGQRAPDAELGPQLRRFIREHEAALRGRIATQRTQTNEIGRCAVLWPALAAIAERAGPAPLALFDFGCSGGLNLEVDRYRYRYEGAAGVWELDPAGLADVADVAAVVADSPLLPCRVLGAPLPAPLLRSPWRIVERAGVDLGPVDLHDESALRWLRACVWPSDAERMQRLVQAAALARTVRRDLRASDDGLVEFTAWLDRLPPGVTPVVFNSWVLAYFTVEALAGHVARMRTLVQQHGVRWLSAEDARRTAAITGRAAPEPAAAIAAEPGAEPGSATWWTLVEPGPQAPTATLLACSHPHGRWLQWLAG